MPSAANLALRPILPKAANANEARTAPVTLVNLGPGPLYIRGPITGRPYRFEAIGDTLRVDARDRVLMATLRQLGQGR